jgi:general secretion pathway protein E/type IV pilus assembly protein PilB
MPRPSEDLDAVQVLDHLVRRAVAMEASDIHIEPKRDMLKVRYRIDGVMVAQGQLPLEIAPPLVTRVKVLSRMDMTERRMPQDGQFSLEFGTTNMVHLRASTFPGIHGETLVLRVLLGHQVLPIDRLGMSYDVIESVNRLISRPSAGRPARARRRRSTRCSRS